MTSTAQSTIIRVISRERFGRPQVWALLLLSAFLAQALWVAGRRPLTRGELLFAHAGLERFRGQATHIAAPPAPAAMAAVPLLLAGSKPESLTPDVLQWTLRLPFVALGWLLGASIWYVARRLYGNAGGYLALALFCFSPLTYFMTPGPLIPGALGLFGTIFVSIAAAHTLYAPARRPQAAWPAALAAEVMHRRRRTVLLAAALALAVGSGQATVLVLAVALAFMIYLVPERAPAAAGIFLAACLMAALGLFALHGFSPQGLRASLAGERILALEAAASPGDALRAYAVGVGHYANGGLVAMALIAVATYAAWRRARYFGNTAPLLVAVFVLAVAPFTAFIAPAGLAAFPFLFVFIGGLFADLLETGRRRLVLAGTVVLMVAYAVRSASEVVRLAGNVLK